jgi:hypothetical protein
VATVDPRVNFHLLLTVSSCPELLERVAPVSEPPFPRVNCIPLKHSTTLVGLASRFLRVIRRVPAEVVKVAEASTG